MLLRSLYGSRNGGRCDCNWNEWLWRQLFNGLIIILAILGHRFY